MLHSISRDPVPADALLKTYQGGPQPDRWGHHDDCFSVTVDGAASLADFVSAFYTSRIFRIERLILALAARAPSTDLQAHAVADGTGDSFAIWRVGARSATQLLMCDRYEKTRSWFQVVPTGHGTTLRFGSAVAVPRDRRMGQVSIGRGFRWLMGFHILYSKLLLKAASARLTRAFAGSLT